MIKVTIIIPTYNRASFLEEALKSILNHTPSIYEVIIADDGSTDSTQTIVQNYQNQKNQTNIIISGTERNYGAQVARNRGLRIASGNYILFMDSDDVLIKNGLEKPFKTLKENTCLDFVYGQVVKVDENLSPYMNTEVIGKEWIDSDSTDTYHWHTMGAVYKKDFLAKVGDWDEDLKGSQDWEYQIRVKLAEGKGQFVESVIGYWRDHSQSRIGTKKFNYLYVKSVILACEKVALNAKKKNKLDSCLAKGIAKKVLFHSVELSVNGYLQERQNALKAARKYLDNRNSLMNLVLFCYIYFFPVNLDFIIWYYLRRRLIQ